MIEREEDENKDVETHKSSPSKLASEQTKQINRKRKG